MVLLLKLQSALLYLLCNQRSDLPAVGCGGQTVVKVSRHLRPATGNRADSGKLPSRRWAGCETRGDAADISVRDGLTYLFSTLNLFSTENTPLTVCARTPAMSLSPCDATTPTSVTCPLSTMMWIGGTACNA